MIIPKFIIDQSIITNELKNLDNILEQQKQLKRTLLSYLEKISESIYNAADITDSNSLISCLDGIRKSFDNIKENINRIIDLKNFLKKYLNSEYINTFDFEKYNQEYSNLFAKISDDNIFYYSFMESILKYMNLEIEKLPTNDFTEIIENNTENQTIENSSNLDSESENLDINNENQETIETNIESKIVSEESNLFDKTLIFFEKEKKAILPYSTSEIIEYYSNNPEKYSSIQDIIDKEYTITFDKFSDPVRSRYKEIYNLAKYKSNMSISKSVAIANKLKSKTDLNPAVVAACNNINELNTYLYYLERNDLEHFTFFKIIYK